MRKTTLAVAFTALLITTLAETMLIDSGKANPFDLPVDTSITIYDPNYIHYKDKQYENSTVTLNIKVILVYGQYNQSWAETVHLDSICYSLDGQPLVYIGNFAVENYTNYGRDKQHFFMYTATVKLENLSEGSHTVTAYANDTHYAPAYINDVSASYNFTVNSHYQAPLIKVLSPINQIYPFSSVSLVFTVNKPVYLIGYSLDGGETIPVTGNVTLSGLSNNLHNVTVYANDTFGNTGVSETISFTVAAPEPEPFPTVPVAVASVASFAVAVVGLLVYFRKRRR